MEIDVLSPICTLKDNRCRACMTEEGNMFPLFDDHNSELFSRCTSLQVEIFFLIFRTPLAPVLIIFSFQDNSVRWTTKIYLLWMLNGTRQCSSISTKMFGVWFTNEKWGMPIVIQCEPNLCSGKVRLGLWRIEQTWNYMATWNYKPALNSK